MRCLFIVSIFESVPSWPSGAHEVEVYGFGEPSLEEARAEATHAVAFWTARNGRPHRAAFHLVCPTCEAHGRIGRRRCRNCNGEGRLPIGN